MKLIFTQPPRSIPATKTQTNIPKVTYIYRDSNFHATIPVQDVERKLLTKVLHKAEVTYGMIKTVQNPTSCCSGAK